MFSSVPWENYSAPQSLVAQGTCDTKTDQNLSVKFHLKRWHALGLILYVQQSCVWLFWLPCQIGHPSTRHSQTYEDELTKNMRRKDAQRVLQREKAHSASPGCLQHLGVGANWDTQQLKVIKLVLPPGFALGVVRRPFWGHEQLGDGKEGGRGSNWKREREEEQGIGNRKGSPHTSLPKEWMSPGQTTENSILTVTLPCYFIAVNELQEQMSVVVISVPFLLYFFFFFFSKIWL